MTVKDLVLGGMSAGADSRRTVELLEAEDEPDDEATEGGPRAVVGDPGEETADSAPGEAESGGANDGWAIGRSSGEFGGKGRSGELQVRRERERGELFAALSRVTKGRRETAGSGTHDWPENQTKRRCAVERRGLEGRRRAVREPGGCEQAARCEEQLREDEPETGRVAREEVSLAALSCLRRLG